MTCSVDDCSRPVKARSMCSSHYGYWYRYERTGTPKKQQRLTECIVDGCDRRPCGRGLCRMHYERKRKGRPIGDAKPLRRPAGTGSVTPMGYVVRYIDGRAILEHRLVMEQILGRKLEPWENVHHRNGDRAFNDPSNLELWVKPQPAGQRAVDLAAWVVATYPDLVAHVARRSA